MQSVSRKKVVLLLSGDLWAGAEVMAYHLLKGLRKYDDLDLSVILLNQGRLAQEIRNLGITVHVVDESKTSFLNIFLTIRDILRKCSPDIIHSHRYKENILACLISGFVRNVKLIATQHGMPEVHGAKPGLKQRLMTKLNFFLLSRFFHQSVVVSRDMQNACVRQYSFKKKIVSVIHNGIDVPEIPTKKCNERSFVIGSCGRLFPVKDYSFMVEIAKTILENTDRVRFELAGDGPERAKLEALLEQYGLVDNTTFVLKGHIEDMSAFYQGIDLYLNTSVHEGIPMSVLEAMSHGLPVIAPKVGGFPEIIDDGVDGYLLSERDPRAFAEKCLVLHENRKIWQEMSLSAREKIVRKFSMENMAAQYRELYFGLA